LGSKRGHDNAMSVWYYSLASLSSFYFSLGKSALCPAVEPAHLWPMGIYDAFKQQWVMGGKCQLRSYPMQALKYSNEFTVKQMALLK